MAAKMMMSRATCTMTRPPARFATISSSRFCARTRLAIASKKLSKQSPRKTRRDNAAQWFARVWKPLNIAPQILRAFPLFFTRNRFENLNEVEGFHLSRETLLRPLRKEGLGSPRKPRYGLAGDDEFEFWPGDGGDKEGLVT